uniref:Cold-regulated 47 n=1 Tax=Tanacetum cinerariifolium TaxID=118510 RepID=A0A699IIN1_TANCI|nr:cold-regulated 47 [Tanacetum cinerariifolium]
MMMLMGVNDVAEAGQAERGDRVVDIGGIEIVANDEIQAIEDYGTSSDDGASVVVKSLVALQGLLERSTLAAKVGGTAATTVPFVTSSVTPTPEHEGGGGGDFATWPIIHSRLAPESLFGTDLSAGSFYISQDMDDETLRRVDRLKDMDTKIASLKAQLSLKEVEAAKAIRLRGQITAVEAVKATRITELNSLRERNDYSLEFEKDKFVDQVSGLEVTCVGLRDEVMGYKLFKERVEEMQDEQMRVLSDRGDYVAAINALRDVNFPLLAQLEANKDSSMAGIMDLLHLEEVAHNRVQRVSGDATARCLSLTDSILPLVEPLSARNLTSEASSSAVLATAEITALSTMFAQTDPVPSVLSTEVSPSPKIIFEEEELDTTSEHVLAPRTFPMRSLSLYAPFPNVSVTSYVPSHLVGWRWILNHELILVLAKCLASPEYLSDVGEAIGRAIDKGMQDGLTVGIEHGRAGRSIEDVAAFNPFAKGDYVAAINALRDVNFPLLAQLEANKDSSMADIMDLLHLEEVAHNHVQRVGGDAIARCLSLTDSILPLVEPLSARNLTSEASSSAVLATAEITALSTMFAQTDPVPSVLSIEVSPSPKIIFEEEELDTTPEHVLAPLPVLPFWSTPDDLVCFPKTVDFCRLFPGKEETDLCSVDFLLEVYLESGSLTSVDVLGVVSSFLVVSVAALIDIMSAMA